MLVKTYGSAIQGVDAIIVTAEVSIESGLNFFIVGLPDNAVRESQYRIEAALRHNGFKIPNRKIVVNLAPADIRKEGSAYDLTIAMGILAATGHINAGRLGSCLIMGELSLDGGLQPVRGALPIALRAREEGFDGLVLPAANAREAAVVNNLRVYGIDNIRQLAGFFNGETGLAEVKVDARREFFSCIGDFELDFADVRGQENIKRALEVAASGGHNLLMIGSPGSGKTMMAKRIPGVLPPFSLREALETTKIHSVAGLLGRNTSLMTTRPFRSPHHTISHAAMAGGGSTPSPGEISLAHNGVLFLDELPEFRHSVLEVLRQPLEDAVVIISRARFRVEYPASFMLVASMNPCPCGYFNHPAKECVCAPGAVSRYLSRISGPLLDRIDIHLEVSPVPFSELKNKKQAESIREIRSRVVRARELQAKRYRDAKGVYCNAQAGTGMLHKVCNPCSAGSTLLKTAMEKLDLSARAYGRILKVSRTIADLEGSDQIRPVHIAEAIHYRSLDRESFWR